MDVPYVPSSLGRRGGTARMSRDLTLTQKAAIIKAERAYPAASFKVSVVTAEAVARRGYGSLSYVPLVKRPGLLLNEHGVRFARTGSRIGQ